MILWKFLLGLLNYISTFNWSQKIYKDDGHINKSVKFQWVEVLVLIIKGCCVFIPVQFWSSLD